MSTPGAASPHAVLVVTGDELLRGFVQDANTGFIARELRRAGVVLAGVRFCSDDLSAITATLRDAVAACADLVVVTGGLGPTHDDRTAEAVAQVSDRPLGLDDAALAVVEERVRSLGRMRTEEDRARFGPGNRKQATVPAGAVVLEPAGTAPGFVVPGAPPFVVLPGPPSELRHAWLQAVATDPVQAVVARVRPAVERLVRAWGIPESHAVVALDELGHEDDDGCMVTLCARDGELELSVRGHDGARVSAVADGVARALGDRVFAVDDERPTADIVGGVIAAAGLTLGLAESCTGGMLASMLTGTPGASGWFLGGVVSYHNDVKRDVLGVAGELLEAHGAVSEPVATAMAAGARATTGADIGVGITGIAGPGGGSAEKPVGTVHVAVAAPWASTHRHVVLPGGRDAVRRRSCMLALHLLREAMAARPG